MTVGDMLEPEEVQSMLDTVDAAYADRAQEAIDVEDSNLRKMAAWGDTDAADLLAKVDGNPLIRLAAEQDAEREFRADELADWPNREDTA